VALDWIANNLGGLTLKDVAKALNDFLQRGEVIEQVPETRPSGRCGRSTTTFECSLLAGRFTSKPSFRTMTRTIRRFI
jgi:hypothetical protein